MENGMIVCDVCMGKMRNVYKNSAQKSEVNLGDLRPRAKGHSNSVTVSIELKNSVV